MLFLLGHAELVSASDFENLKQVQVDVANVKLIDCIAP